MNLRGLGLLVPAGAALLLQLSCAATVLAPAEEKVRITENASDVKGCQVLGPVEARGPYKVPDEWKIQFRNQGLQLGADTVVLNHFSVLAQSFSGMAYRCAQAAAAETAAPAVVPAPPPAPVADAPRVVSAAPPSPAKLGEGGKSSEGETRSPEQSRVIKAMESMYLAATTDDLDLFHSVTAPEFFAFDNGSRFDGDALMQLVKNLRASGKTYVWSVTEPRVEIFGDTALITYVNRGSVQDESGKMELTWLESALLRKDNGTWRIRFLHSTRMP
jgi:ketosteroid isomerase-like protein